MERYNLVSHSAMLYSCIGIAVVAALYEGLKFLREFLMLKAKRRMTYGKSCW